MRWDCMPMARPLELQGPGGNGAFGPKDGPIGAQAAYDRNAGMLGSVSEGLGHKAGLFMLCTKETKNTFHTCH